MLALEIRIVGQEQMKLTSHAEFRVYFQMFCFVCTYNKHVVCLQRNKQINKLRASNIL